jgi:hypothetical protein
MTEARIPGLPIVNKLPIVINGLMHLGHSCGYHDSVAHQVCLRMRRSTVSRPFCAKKQDLFFGESVVAVTVS